MLMLLKAQTLIFEGDFGEKLYDLQAITKLDFTGNDSLSQTALSIHTSIGIRQLALAQIDSIYFDESQNVVVSVLGEPREFRSADIDYFSLCPITIPDRSTEALQGSQFMQQILNMEFAEREPLIKNQILAGNIPDFLRDMIHIQSVFRDASSNNHTVEYDVMPDYLAIGSTGDFCRVPMGPQSAQAIADAFGCILPTRKLVDDIWQHATVHLTPIPYAPVGTENNKVYKFIQHNTDIEAARVAAGGQLGELIAGIKKDVVITNQLKTKPTCVAIYGWHYTTGVPIQSLYTGHVNFYVDYSHGIRLVSAVMRVDGVPMRAQDILADPVLYTLISDESGVMTQPYYLY
jgi:hypothetical protein